MRKARAARHEAGVVGDRGLRLRQSIGAGMRQGGPGAVGRRRGMEPFRPITVGTACAQYVRHDRDIEWRCKNVGAGDGGRSGGAKMAKGFEPPVSPVGRFVAQVLLRCTLVQGCLDIQSIPRLARARVVGLEESVPLDVPGSFQVWRGFLSAHVHARAAVGGHVHRVGV